MNEEQIVSPEAKDPEGFIHEYRFGIDRASFRSISLNSTCGELYEDILVGDAEFLTLDAKYHQTSDSSIEFSIIDKEKEIPILPIGEDYVEKEKIFFGMSTRFKIDPSEAYIIRDGSSRVEATIEHVLQAGEGNYSISYKPMNPHKYSPNEETVGLKVILRKEGENKEIPYVESMILRIHGGGTLWSDRQAK